MVDLNKGATVELVKALSDDIRTLPDGTKASSAGAAVRGQISEVINARVGADGTSYQTLKERLDKEILPITDIELSSSTIPVSSWTAGMYDTSTGEEVAHNPESHIRAVIPDDIINIKITDSRYAVVLYCYSQREFLGWWNGTGFTQGSGSEAYQYNVANLSAIRELGATVFKVVLRKKDLSNISTSESTVFLVLTSTINKLSAEIDNEKAKIDIINSTLYTEGPSDVSAWKQGMYDTSTGEETDTFESSHIRASVPNGCTSVTITSGDYAMVLYGYNKNTGFIGWWNGEEFVTGSGSESIVFTSFNIKALYNPATTNQFNIVLRKINRTDIALSESQNVSFLISKIDEISEKSDSVEDTALGKSKLIDTQRAIANDWYIPFIDVMGLGMGNNHLIPETAKIWNPSGTTDLTQNEILMSDGVHPTNGNGVVKAYGITISNQLSLISPFYYHVVDEKTSNFWNGKSMVWFGTSIPAGSDPTLGVQGESYPAYVGELLGATVTNQARGSSCVRINASGGDYKGMKYNHFLRSLSRTVDECDQIAENWANIQPLIFDAPSTLSSEDIAIMKEHSFENLLLPFLDGTNNMPDVFILDHGFNDRRPLNANGVRDFTLNPTMEQIDNGNLAVDTYMTDNNYANLKTALNSQLTGISDLEKFSTSINRYTYIGAMNFIITLILRYNPQARIIIVSSYIT